MHTANEFAEYSLARILRVAVIAYDAGWQKFNLEAYPCFTGH